MKNWVYYAAVILAAAVLLFVASLIFKDHGKLPQAPRARSTQSQVE